MNRHADIAALILAAGYSSRMKYFKPLLPLGEATTLERCVRLFKESGIEDVRVVIGHRSDELKPLLDNLQVRYVVNTRFADGMFSSVRTGVASLDSSCCAFFLLPVDIPLVRQSTILDLLEARATRPADIFYPTFQGKRGHPPLVATTCRSGLLAWNGDGGLRGFFEQHSSELHGVDVPVADEHMLLDMDTNGDYQALLARFEDFDVPSYAECEALLRDIFAVNETVLAHSVTVERVASTLAQALNEAGCRLNLKLITAAALLHDLAKGQPDHAAVAERLVEARGYPLVARVVGAHTDVTVVPGEAISEREIVCLADKMVQIDRIVSIETRFCNRLLAFGADAQALEGVMRRRANILTVKRRLEAALGCSVEAVLHSRLAETEGDTDACVSLQARTDRAQ